MKPFKLWGNETLSTSRNMAQLNNTAPSSRDYPTLPPPPPGATAVELDQRAADLRRIAAQILARANDLETVSAAMRGER